MNGAKGIILLENLFMKLPILASFIGGIVTFLSPCILPLIPSYMFYLAGSANDEKYSPIKIFINAILFVCGFGIVFFLFGLAMVNVMDNIFSAKIFRYISGGIVIIFGLHFLRIFEIKFLYAVKKINLQKLEQNRFLKIISPFIFGLTFALGWTPCTGPIVSSIGFLAASNENLAIISLVFFIFGLGVPFLLLALFLAQGLKIIGAIKKYMRYIEIFSGVFLIFVGLLIIFGQVNVVVDFIS